MAGYWENNQKRVLCSIIHTEITTMKWAIGLKNLQIPGNIFNCTAAPFDQLRNTCAEVALKNNFDYIFFLDSDVVAPPDTIFRLMNSGIDIISGVYYRRSPPQGVPVMRKNNNWYIDYPKNSIVEVDFVGAGCLLISKKALLSIPFQRPELGKKWFDWRVDCPTKIKNYSMSEDFTFNEHARKYGFKTYVDTSIQCLHIGLGEAMEKSFLPALCNI